MCCAHTAASTATTQVHVSSSVISYAVYHRTY